jgi:hypothetical protein
MLRRCKRWEGSAAELILGKAKPSSMRKANCEHFPDVPIIPVRRNQWQLRAIAFDRVREADSFDDMPEASGSAST